MKRKTTLIKEMAELGWDFNIDSDDEWLIFTSRNYGFVMYFTSWKQVAEWLNGVVID